MLQRYLILAALILVFGKARSQLMIPDSFQIKYIQQNVDHFSFANNRTFQQKYLINDQFWDSENHGPIFFVPGKETPIEEDSFDTFTIKLAKDFGALLVAGEHRYYGESMPFGNESLSADPSKNGYLTSSQSLADQARLITHIKGTLQGAKNSPVIAFGVSYGGEMSAWCRVKYPHLFDGSIASSAPIRREAPCNSGYKVVTNNFNATKSGPKCVETIKQSWAAIDRVASQAGGMEWLKTEFCNESTNYVDVLKYHIKKTFWDDDMEKIEEICRKILDSAVPHPDDKSLIQQIAAGLNCGKCCGPLCCLDKFPNVSISPSDPHLLTLDDPWTDRASAYHYLECTGSFGNTFCTTGKDDMFYDDKFSLDKVSDFCYKTFKVRPRSDMMAVTFGSGQLEAASNIVFSNGERDPWSGAGVKEDINEKVIAVWIKDGAHGSDFAYPPINKSAEKAQEIERQHIKKWIKEAREKHRPNN